VGSHVLNLRMTEIVINNCTYNKESCSRSNIQFPKFILYYFGYLTCNNVHSLQIRAIIADRTLQIRAIIADRTFQIRAIIADRTLQIRAIIADRISSCRTNHTVDSTLYEAIKCACCTPLNIHHIEKCFKYKFLILITSILFRVQTFV
jgi:hypothetical protein